MEGAGEPIEWVDSRPAPRFWERPPLRGILVVVPSMFVGVALGALLGSIPDLWARAGWAALILGLDLAIVSFVITRPVRPTRVGIGDSGVLLLFEAAQSGRVEPRAWGWSNLEVRGRILKLRRRGRPRPLPVRLDEVQLTRMRARFGPLP